VKPSPPGEPLDPEEPRSEACELSAPSERLGFAAELDALSKRSPSALERLKPLPPDSLVDVDEVLESVEVSRRVALSRTEAAASRLD